MLAAQVEPGCSRRDDFQLIPSKTALLIIDIQDHVSSSMALALAPGSSNSPSEGYQDDNYLFATALPQALPKMVQLVETFRSIRDRHDEDAVTNKNDEGFSGDVSVPSSSSGSNCCCEVVFTYLESLTTNNRDISLDYKLSGELLSTKLPNTVHRATFTQVPPSLRPNPTSGKGDILIPKTSCSVFTSTNINYVLRNLQVEQIVICGQLTDQCVLSAVRDGADLGYFVTVVEDACAATSPVDHERGIAGVKGFSRVVKTNDVLKEICNVSHENVTAHMKDCGDGDDKEPPNWA